MLGLTKSRDMAKCTRPLNRQKAYKVPPQVNHTKCANIYNQHFKCRKSRLQVQNTTPLSPNKLRTHFTCDSEKSQIKRWSAQCDLNQHHHMLSQAPVTSPLCVMMERQQNHTSISPSRGMSGHPPLAGSSERNALVKILEATALLNGLMEVSILHISKRPRACTMQVEFTVRTR